MQQKRAPHIPFRDRASTPKLKPSFRNPRAVASNEILPTEEELAGLRETALADLEDNADLVASSSVVADPSAGYHFLFQNR